MLVLSTKAWNKLLFNAKIYRKGKAGWYRLHFLYLFISFYFLAVPALHCCMGFSLVVVSGDCPRVAVWVLYVAVASRCRARLLRHVDSVVVAPEFWGTGSVLAHGFSCSELYGIFPDQESNACLLHRQVDSLPVRHQGSPSSPLEQWFSNIGHHHIFW